MQALIPRQAAESVTPPLVCKGSTVLGLPAGDSSSGFQADLNLSPGGVQAVQELIPRQAAGLVTPLVCKCSPVLGLPAGDSSGFQGDLSLSPGGVQAVDSLL